MSKSNSWENSLLLLLFQNTGVANVGDATGLRGSTVAGSLYWGLHTADPGEAGSQTTGETAYTSYARQPAARSSGGFTVTANSVAPAANVDFPKCTGASSDLLTHWSLGTAVSGTGVLLYSGELGKAQGVFTALASNDTLTVPGVNSLAVNDRICVHALPGTSLPTGLTDGTVYFVKTVSGSAVTLAATAGGATIDLTVDGAGIAFKVEPIQMALNVIPRIEAASTSIVEE
jgi:hypothetical protein